MPHDHDEQGKCKHPDDPKANAPDNPPPVPPNEESSDNPPPVPPNEKS